MEDVQIPKPTNGQRKAEIKIEKTKWTNRRAMAWVSLISMIVVTLALLFTNLVSVEKLKVLSDVITWFYLSMASIIGAYMGVTTWAHIKSS